jgi:hypothetical protein
MAKKPTPIPPYTPPTYQKADCTALIALSQGTANEFQQKRILELLVNRLCETYGLSYRPGGAEADRDTAFAEGKRFVGTQIVKLINTNPDIFKE